MAYTPKPVRRQEARDRARGRLSPPLCCQSGLLVHPCCQMVRRSGESPLAFNKRRWRRLMALGL